MTKGKNKKQKAKKESIKDKDFKKHAKKKPKTALKKKQTVKK